VDWRIGAEFFEMHLVDYDTCSKWVSSVLMDIWADMLS
jgi:deoxyribodipyrimidine photolyase